jgi:hypothetical protein
MKPMLIVPVRIPASCSARRFTVFCIRGFQSFISGTTYLDSEPDLDLEYPRR